MATGIKLDGYPSKKEINATRTKLCHNMNRDLHKQLLEVVHRKKIFMGDAMEEMVARYIAENQR